MSDTPAEIEAQVLKARDDAAPVRLVRAEEAEGGEERFALADGASCSWLKTGESISRTKLRQRVEPWLTALSQSDHVSLLVGSGLMHAVHHMAAGAPGPGMDKVDLAENAYARQIETEVTRSAEAAGRGNGNLEDQLRVALELQRGLAILASENEDDKKALDDLGARLKKALVEFAASILKGEVGILGAAAPQRTEALNYLVTFLMSLASRSGTRDRLHIFTTNYDRLIEAGADVAGLRLIDRFVGSLSPIYRSSRLELDLHYNPPGIRGEPRVVEGVARLTKLHGSIDWVEDGRDIRRMGLPFGAPDVEPFLAAVGAGANSAMQLMIYPNSAKDRETAGYPYVDLFRDFAAAACRPNHVLFTYGYSFGDEHINRVVEDMLTIPSSHLVVIARSDSIKRVAATYERMGRPSQITLLLGDHFGDLKTLVDWYLPKPSIDRSTRRMSDLIKSRLGGESRESQGGAGDAEPAGGES